jgi:hypothetical protein
MLPVFRRFTQQDYPEAPNWLGQLFGPLNTFAETTVATFNKNLVVGQNVQGQKYSTSFTTGAGSPYTMTPVEFRYTGGGQPDCCVIGKISPVDGTAITTPVSITQWFMNLNTNPYTVTINYIAGLSANTKYNITFLVI